MKIIEFLKNWFQENGLIKIFVALTLLIISTLVVRNTHSLPLMDIFNIVGLVSGGYLFLTLLVFTIVGIANSFKKP